MTDVFISYSRKDKDFVQVLHQALTQSRYEAWVDWQDIPLTADWWAEIEAGIEAADTFIFVMTPDSLASKVCEQEINHAVSHNKRLIPIVRREGFDEIHPALGKHNWLFFREEDNSERALASLISAINTDLEHVRAHTRLLVQALEWEKKQRRDDVLLRGVNLTEAEQWLEKAQFNGLEPLPTEQQKIYITKSREVEVANQRLAAAGEKAKRLVQVGAGVLAATLAIAAVVGLVTQRNFRRAQQLTHLEQSGLKALEQFQYQEIEALVAAMQAAQDLRRLKGGGDRPLREYASHSPPWALQQILDQVREHNQIVDPDTPAEKVSFSPDSQILAVTSRAGRVQLRRPNGSLLVTLPHYLPVWSASFTPDSQRVATASSDGMIRLWDVQGNLLNTWPTPFKGASTVQISPNGQYIAVSEWNNRDIVLWDAQGKERARLKGHTGSVKNVRFSPSGQILASTSEDGTVRLWDLQGNPKRVLQGHQGITYGLAFSPDGKYLVSGSSDDTARIWNLETEEFVVLPDHNGYVYDASFFPDGQQLATVSSGGVARVWDLQGNRKYDLPGHSGLISSIQVSANGQWIASAASDGKARIWSLQDTAISTLVGHQDLVWGVDFSPTSDRIATASIDGTVRLWNLQGRELKRLSGSIFTAVSFSPDGKLLATGAEQGKTQIWTADGNPVADLPGHLLRVQNLAFSPDSQRLATASYDGTARLWTLKDNSSVVVQHDDWVRGVAFSPDGQTFATSSEDATAKIWDFEGNLLAELKGHADGINDLSFTPDGTRIVTASDDSTVRIWNLQGQELASFQKHRGRVWSLAVSPTSEYLATGSAEGLAHLWDMQGNQVAAFRGHSTGILGVNFSANGQYLATSEGGGVAKVWSIPQSLDDLLAQGCLWLRDFLVSHPEELQALTACHSEALLLEAAPAMVQLGDRRAKAGDRLGALQAYRIAQTWNSRLEVHPKVRLQALQQVAEGDTLAQVGEVEAAIAQYEKARALVPNLDLDPSVHARQTTVAALLKAGSDLAEAGSVDEAVSKFKQAVALDPAIPFDPEDQAAQIAALFLIGRNYSQITAEAVKDAVTASEEIHALNPQVVLPAETAANLCLRGSLYGFAKQVLSVCDQAVANDPFPGRWRSRRAVARSIVGDQTGATADLEAYISWASTTEAFPKEALQLSLQKRQAWLEVLQTGQNPFTAEVIEQMKAGDF